MLHAYVQRFDVTENLEKICKILGTKQALIIGGKSRCLLSCVVKVVFESSD